MAYICICLPGYVGCYIYSDEFVNEFPYLSVSVSLSVVPRGGAVGGHIPPVVPRGGGGGGGGGGAADGGWGDLKTPKIS